MSTIRPGQQDRCHLHLVPAADGHNEWDAPTVPERPALYALAAPAATDGERRAIRKAVLASMARVYGPLVAVVAVLAAVCWAWLPAWWGAPAWGLLAPYHLALLLVAAVLVTMAGDYAVRLDRRERRLPRPALPPSPAELGRTF